MNFPVKMPENCKKNVFRDKKTKNKLPLMLLDVKVLTERQQLHYSTLPKTSKVQCMYLAFKNLKIESKKGQK